MDVLTGAAVRSSWIIPALNIVAVLLWRGDGSLGRVLLTQVLIAVLFGVLVVAVTDVRTRRELEHAQSLSWAAERRDDESTARAERRRAIAVTCWWLVLLVVLRPDNPMLGYGYALPVLLIIQRRRLTEWQAREQRRLWAPAGWTWRRKLFFDRIV